MREPSIPQSEFVWRKEVLERLTELKTILAPLPDRVASIEDDVNSLKESRARDRGLVAGISLAVSAGFAIIKTYLGLP